MSIYSIELTDQEDKSLTELVNRGQFKSAEEAIKAGMSKLIEQDSGEEAKWDRLFDGVEKGRQDIRDGKYVLLDSEEAIHGFFETLGNEFEDEETLR